MLMKIELKRFMSVRNVVLLIVICLGALYAWNSNNFYLHKIRENLCMQRYSLNFVEQQLDQYRSCENLTDCVQIQGTMCGYQRGTLVNKQYVTEAQKLISACESTACAEDGTMMNPNCENHRCVYKIAQPGEPPPIPLY